MNARLDAVQAPVLRAKLRRLDAWNDARRAAAARYGELLADIDGVRAPVVRPGNEDVWHLYVVQVDARDRVMAQMNKAGVGVALHYPTPIHLTEAYAGLGYGRGQFPVSEAAADHILSLPMFPHLTDDFVEGASLWGVSKSYLSAAREQNLRPPIWSSQSRQSSPGICSGAPHRPGGCPMELTSSASRASTAWHPLMFHCNRRSSVWSGGSTRGLTSTSWRRYGALEATCCSLVRDVQPEELPVEDLGVSRCRSSRGVDGRRFAVRTRPPLRQR